MQRFIAIMLFVIVLPFLIIFMIGILIGSKGNPIFTQNRVGKGGKVFVIYKLRTMKLGLEPNHIHCSRELELHEHYRITKFGQFLRKAHLDEIPQLWNIILGDMSFVGPRPLQLNLCRVMKYYAPRDKNVLPGLTGLAQISQLRGVEGYNTSKLDKFYFKKKNILLDLSICFLTIFRILLNK